MGTTTEAFPPLRLIIEAGITPFQSGFGPRRFASLCLDKLRNAKTTSSTYTTAWMMTRRRASRERPSQAARGVFDSFWLIVQFYHRKRHRETNHNDEPVGENTLITEPRSVGRRTMLSSNSRQAISVW